MMILLRSTFQKIESLLRLFAIPHSFSPISLSKPLRSSIIAKLSTLITPTYDSVLTDFLKNRKFDDARDIFERILNPDMYLCTKMIAGYAENYRLNEALELFDKMPVKDVITWNSMIRGCLDCGNLDMGLRVFSEMPERNVISWTTMMNGFLRFGRVEEAEKLFWGMPMRDIAAWNAMIFGYFENFRAQEAVKLFEMMPYRNVISWTSMISGLEKHGRNDEALLIFRKMMDFEVKPTSSTITSVITACASASELALGVQIHGLTVKLGYLFDAYVIASLITFYANCKLIDDSRKVFHEKVHMNVVVWTSLLTGYGSNDEHQEALNVFGNMVRNGIPPNQSSFTSALNSCCEMEIIDQGKGIHGAAVKLGLGTDVFVGNSLVVLYSKCGNICDGIATFKEIVAKNIVSWNSIIVGCAQHGCCNWALTFFSQMIRAGVYPDDITFTGLLSACSHSGMSRKGRKTFEYLRKSKTTEAKLEHYACMLDLLCRSGELEEAENLVKNMPVRANMSMWLALLNGCRKQSNIELAERVAKQIFYLDPHCSSAPVLLSNIYAFAGKWSDVARVRAQMKKSGAIKQRGCSWVTQKGVKHAFVSGDRSHPLTKSIYEKLEWLGEKLKESGHVPDQRFALHDVEDEQKETALSHHSERLAICFALVSSVDGSTITVMKNLRVCGDCHSAIKIIAKVVEREIILRDSSRFHHFRDGFCSCGDYW
ncbi:hypothetical protein M9H77_11121 [Catharanthus roseus]|uniref:Uncharacterized protein n=1 Tax=Catharanthus roseus TaxID=4058 RepID=A0ACC0BDP8_CATRO|nr:hypothetical protein M9H77_11121 [Catharanthus roseus]